MESGDSSCCCTRLSARFSRDYHVSLSLLRPVYVKILDGELIRACGDPYNMDWGRKRIVRNPSTRQTSIMGCLHGIMGKNPYNIDWGRERIVRNPSTRQTSIMGCLHGIMGKNPYNIDWGRERIVRNPSTRQTSIMGCLHGIMGKIRTT